MLQLATLLSALLSICCMVFLGFADDVLNLRWRQKIVLPMVATIPLLMAYYVSIDRTEIVLPRFVEPWLGRVVDLGGWHAPRRAAPPHRRWLTRAAEVPVAPPPAPPPLAARPSLTVAR